MCSWATGFERDNTSTEQKDARTNTMADEVREWLTMADNGRGWEHLLLLLL
jgi:hypothetical protein